MQPGGQHIARAADITLGNADLQFNFDDANFGFDLGPSDGIGSQDYDVDLNLDFGDGPAAAARSPSRMDEDDMSVEVGRRDSVAPPQSVASHLIGPHGADDLDLLSVRSRALSERPFDDMDMGFGPGDAGMDVDIGISFDEPLSEHAPTPRLTPSRACKSSTCLIMLVDSSREQPLLSPSHHKLLPQRSSSHRKQHRRKSSRKGKRRSK